MPVNSTDIDPDNWEALRGRIRRLQQTRRSEGDSAVTPRAIERAKRAKYDIRSALKRDDISAAENARWVASAIDDLSDEENGELADELAHIDVVRNLVSGKSAPKRLWHHSGCG